MRAKPEFWYAYSIPEARGATIAVRQGNEDGLVGDMKCDGS